MKILAILCVRNEATFLLDWMAHHRAVGVTDFLVFSNDCDDGTDEMLDRLAEMGWLTHVRNEGPFGKGGVQFSALKQADKMQLVKEAEWLLPLDVDEFVNVHVGDHTLPALLQALPQATAIPLTWRIFGNGGVVHFEDRPVTEQFTKAAPVVMHWPWRSAMFKTLYRNDGTYRNLGVHRPRNPRDEKLKSSRWFDGEGRELSEAYHSKYIFSQFGRSNYKLAQLNHYPLGAMESYVVKADRGRAVHADHMLGLDYWVERNFSIEEDRSVLATSPLVKQIRAELSMDPILSQLHIAAVKWRKTRFNELLAQEPYRALFGRLLMTPPSQPLPPQAAQFLLRHARAAQLPSEGL